MRRHRLRHGAIVGSRRHHHADLVQGGGGWDPKGAHSVLGGVVDRIQDMRGRPLSLNELQQIRTQAGANARDPHPSVREAAGRILSSIDGYINNVDPVQSSAAGLRSGHDVGAKWQEARKLWRTANTIEDLNWRVDKAGRRAASTNSGQNEENAIRQNIRQVVDKSTQPGRFNPYSPAELEQMERVVRGHACTECLALGGELRFRHSADNDHGRRRCRSGCYRAGRHGRHRHDAADGRWWARRSGWSADTRSRDEGQGHRHRTGRGRCAGAAGVDRIAGPAADATAAARANAGKSGAALGTSVPDPGCGQVWRRVMLRPPHTIRMQIIVNPANDRAHDKKANKKTQRDDHPLSDRPVSNDEGEKVDQKIFHPSHIRGS